MIRRLAVFALILGGCLLAWAALILTVHALITI